MSSTFAGFTAAQLGLRASQQGLNITGQNISNINTGGYTRQVLDQISLNLSNCDRYSASEATIGYGTLVTDISQIRDPYLDIRFRNEAADVGNADEMYSTLQELESALDESKTDGIQAQLSDLSSMLQKLSGSVDSGKYASSVKSSAESLTKFFNQYANSLKTTRNDLENNLTKVDVPDINEILENITELNKTIKSGQINGDDALELMDQRNMLIDNLSSYVKIDVQYIPEKISDSLSVDNLKIDLVGNNNTINLVNGNDHNTFKIPDGTTKLNVVDSNGDPIKDLSGNDIGTDIYDELSSGSIKGSLEMLNCSGVFDSDDNSTRGIGYYEKMLDLLASKFAKTFNDLNNSTLPAGTPDADLHNLFSTSDGSTTITAANITLASGWSKDDYGLTTTTSTDPDSSGANDVIMKMINALKDDQSFVYSPDSNPSNDKTVFTGSFTEFYSTLNTTLGIDAKSTKQTLQSHVAVANNISDKKDSISGVSLDDECVNLMKYQKSYSAAARLMTTLDEAMDTLINKMGVVGR
ncbi:MAG: flagellar hook-associated protein FlgK [Clostridia bacterium]|jgi:flagellar hook-associated protein 1 FlgK|nr:flagellar hook-associated protein FlgK [Clostridia bacterium]